MEQDILGIFQKYTAAQVQALKGLNDQKSAEVGAENKIFTSGGTCPGFTGTLSLCNF